MKKVKLFKTDEKGRMKVVEELTYAESMEAFENQKTQIIKWCVILFFVLLVGFILIHLLTIRSHEGIVYEIDYGTWNNIKDILGWTLVLYIGFLIGFTVGQKWGKRKGRKMERLKHIFPKEDILEYVREKKGSIFVEEEDDNL